MCVIALRPVQFTNTHIANNEGSKGGGVYVVQDSSLLSTVSTKTITDADSLRAAFVAAVGGSAVEFNGSLLTGNRADSGAGGGLFMYHDGGVLIYNCPPATDAASAAGALLVNGTFLNYTAIIATTEAVALRCVPCESWTGNSAANGYGVCSCAQ